MKLAQFFILFFATNFYGQSINGNFPQKKNNEIILIGFDGFVEKELSKTTTDSLGRFRLNYPENYVGSAILQVKNGSSLIVLLNKEFFSIECANLQDFATLNFSGSPENDLFSKGIEFNREVEQKLVGLNYLLKQYQNQTNPRKWLLKEIKNQDVSLDNFINSLPKENYVKAYLKLRKFLSVIQNANKLEKHKELVLQIEKNFKNINFRNEEIWNSGLLNEILNGIYLLLENTYKDKSIISEHIIEINKVWLEQLKLNPTKLEAISDFCFNLFEKKNFTKVSEHIALSMLNQDKCQISDKNIDAFEQYRKLGIGKIAPDIVFNSFLEKSKKTGKFNYVDLESSNKMSLLDLPNKYKLLVFGASWCPNCQTDYPSLVGKYKKLKELYDLEVIYVSIDTEFSSFAEYYKNAPFILFCDTMGWDSQIVKGYHVFATPTYFLLDSSLKIVSKITAPEQLDEVLESLKN
jgi:thiol-disulfide isomerase/thioredoxin